MRTKPPAGNTHHPSIHNPPTPASGVQPLQIPAAPRWDLRSDRIDGCRTHNKRPARWTAIPLTGTIPAKGYYLIALAGGDYAYDLPKADASGSYDLAAKQGKVALVRTATPLAVASPLGLANLRDFVGYGNAYADARNSATPVTLRNKQLLPKPRR